MAKECLLLIATDNKKKRKEVNKTEEFYVAFKIKTKCECCAKSKYSVVKQNTKVFISGGFHLKHFVVVVFCLFF